MSLLRCSMSSAVIGSPLTMTTTCWARAAGASMGRAITIIAAASAARHVVDLSSMVVPSASSAGTCRATRTPLAGPSGLASAQPAIVERRDPRAAAIGVSAERTQADLRHERVVDRHATAVGVICNVIQGQDEAIVHISDADLGLADLVGPQVVSRCGKHDPVRGR